MEFEIFGPPNPALTAILNGNDMRAWMLRLARSAKVIYVENVAHGQEDRYGEEHLYESAAAFTEKTYGRYGSRWAGVMEVSNPHFLPHEEGWETQRDREVMGSNDLNMVLELMSV